MTSQNMTLYTLQTDYLSPSHDVLKECVNGEH